MSRTIFFNNADKSTSLRFRTILKSFIHKQCHKEGIQVETLQYVFCSDNYLLDINKQFLNHDFYTDIISFDLSEEKGVLIGDVYIQIFHGKWNKN
jgi:ssRNA-specific RNase YbeY (16S rRNA maturation enzyme)